MSDEFAEIREAFKVEASEILTALEASLLDLEKDPDNMEMVSSIFRSFHTLKGSGGMCGFDDISAFTHQIETVYDLVRNWKIEADKSLFDLTLSACDHIRDMMNVDQLSREAVDNRTADILAMFRKFIPEERKAPKILKQAGLAEEIFGEEEQTKKTVYRIRFRPSRDIFLRGTNPLLLIDELRTMGDCRVIAHTQSIPALDLLDAEACYTSWDIILTTTKGLNDIQDVFIFIQDETELSIDIIYDGDADLDAEDFRKLGEILIEKQDIRKENLEQILRERKRLGELLVEEGLVQEVSIQAALAEQEQVKQVREDRQKIEATMNIRVASRKLDKLINLVGELVTVQARLSQTSLRYDDPELLLIAEEVERLIEELRDTSMNIRMLPMGTTFGKFKRLVRDLTAELGKEAELFTEGAETELDKTVIEKLNDPLVHIIRNCVDHGIELPDLRRQQGKPRKGSIRLSAVHSGAYVVIQIQDDGAGLNKTAIHTKALQKGLIQPDDELSEREIFNLILAPGFTTSGSVTSVSGRGVGMDVVKKAVDNLRGTIKIESLPGEGTTITLSLPLTLAIIEGLLVKVGTETFVMPLSIVEECIELTGQAIKEGHGRNLVNVRSQIVPYIRLREQFAISGNEPAIQQVVIANTEGRRVGFAVDSVIGEHQTVIKSLGKFYRDVRGISGATILGDGSVALILDMPQLIQMVETEENA
ncbi:MAG: chemotaxis protein CheA [Nitrospirae bacterium]|nr:chemotaxis protein CheA [Nitrospirota bacterium]